MTVKTGSAWAGMFVTLDATGALAAGTPSGALYVDGVADAATVTITGSNPYKWAVTLPTLTAGQRVDMYITATIATIATAGIVASAQADTVLVSEIAADMATVDEVADGVWNEATSGHVTAGSFGAALGGVADSVLDEVVIGTYTMRQLLKVLVAKMVGKATGGGTTTITYRGVDDTSNVVVETVDTNGNRSAVTLTV